MMAAKPTIIELDMNKLEDVLRRVESNELRAEDCQTIRTLFQSYVHLTELLKNKNTSLARLRKLLFGIQTEKTAAVVGLENDAGIPPSTQSSAPAPSVTETPSPPSGHGRKGAEAYHSAEKIEVSHESLQPGDICPECQKGTVYDFRPGVLVRLVGQAPVQAKVYYLQKLRCHLCGRIFTAQAPEGLGAEKYDATVGSMLALLKYGSGMPFNRMEGLQGNLGIPLPASTQWDIVHAQAERAEPVFEELLRQAAQGDVVYNDDTTARILELMGQRARQALLAEEAGPGSAKKTLRKGLFTTGIVSTREGRRIALFLTGQKHAGENLKDVLVRRAKDRPPPIQMCDALSRNMPAEFETILAHCLAHGRRQFVDVAEHFPDECRHVLQSLSVIYRVDAQARIQELSPEERLRFHQTQSGPVMEELHAWLARQLDDRLVERNSGLGGAISYLLKHWEQLTLFLRQPGAPLDNNICERALKKAILHRKNALFYKTSRGAHVGDVFMTLIHTCEFCGANPFEYLTELDRHAAAASEHPQHWMPWNYRQPLDALAAAEIVL